MSITLSNPTINKLFLTTTVIILYFFSLQVNSRILRFNNSTSKLDYDSLLYLWPLPSNYTSGNVTLSVDPDFKLSLSVPGGSPIVRDAFERYKSIIFKHAYSHASGSSNPVYDLSSISIVVSSGDDELQLGTDENYKLVVSRTNFESIVSGVTILANTVYGAVRGLETFSQLYMFDYGTKTVEIHKAPRYIRDKPRFAYRGLLLDTSRHYYPVEVIKQIIESMSYAKLNVFHWHIIDEQSFPLEVTTYSYLWKGAYSKWERYTVEDAREIVNFAKERGINVMAEIDVPGHAESWMSPDGEWRKRIHVIDPKHEEIFSISALPSRW